MKRYLLLQKDDNEIITYLKLSDGIIYDESHSEGVIAVKNTYEEIADLYTDLISIRKSIKN